MRNIFMRAKTRISAVGHTQRSDCFTIDCYVRLMRQSPMILAGALAVGLVGGIMLPRNVPTPAPHPADLDWVPRDTIKRHPLMTADDLDGQQPDAVAFSPQRQSAQPAASWLYRNCREARASGAAPIYRGQPGYGAHMDGDNDGIACEPYPR